MSEQETNQSKIISFRLGDQEFCIDIMVIREIRGWAEPTPLPHSPPHVTGMINLRGSVIPVIDMALRLGLPSIKPNERTAIIVVEIHNKLVGLLVEQVSDMLTIDKKDIQPVPEVGTTFDRSFAQGIVAVEKNMVCFLNLGAVFGGMDNQEQAA